MVYIKQTIFRAGVRARPCGLERDFIFVFLFYFFPTTHNAVGAGGGAEAPKSRPVQQAGRDEGRGGANEIRSIVGGGGNGERPRQYYLKQTFTPTL